MNGPANIIEARKVKPYNLEELQGRQFSLLTHFLQCEIALRIGVIAVAEVSLVFQQIESLNNFAAMLGSKDQNHQLGHDLAFVPREK